MNNIQEYEDFVNESIFGSKFDFLVKKIKKAISEIPPKDIRVTKFFADQEYAFTWKTKKEVGENDPFGEDTEDLCLKCEFRKNEKSSISSTNKYSLTINDEYIPISYLEARSLFNLVKDRKNNEKKIAEKEREDTLYKKYKEVDKYL